MRAAKYVGSGIIALACVLTGGCDEPLDSEEEFIEPLENVVQISVGPDGQEIVTFRDIADNGIEGNGFRFNGYRFNGYRFNGYRFNGYRFNGYRFNGSAFNNVSLNSNGRLQGDEGTMEEGDEVSIDSDNDQTGEDYEIKLSEQEAVPGRTRFKFQRIRYRVKPGNTWDDACRDGYNNPTKGILLPYTFNNSTGEVSETPVDGSSWACRGTALGKCVEWGWHPKEKGTHRFTGATNQSFFAIYRACTRMVRADYNGDGQHHTANGTPIDIEDVFGKQYHESTWQMEAAWGPQGVLCLNTPRKLSYTRASIEAERGEAIPQCGSHDGTVEDRDNLKQYWYDQGALLITLNVPS